MIFYQTYELDYQTHSSLREHALCTDIYLLANKLSFYTKKKQQQQSTK